MYDLEEDLNKIAEATTESAKLATAVVKEISNLAGFCAKVVDEPFLELVGIWVDNKKYDRWENLVKIRDKVNAELKKRGCQTIRMIPPKIGIPLIDNALLEDDDDLREIWCKLIANSLDSNFKKEIRSSFVEIIRELNALDAKILKYIYENMPDKNNLHKIDDYNKNTVKTEDIIRHINAQESDIYISLFNLKRIQCIWDYTSCTKSEKPHVSTLRFNNGKEYTLTPLGHSLVEACVK